MNHCPDCDERRDHGGCVRGNGSQCCCDARATMTLTWHRIGRDVPIDTATHAHGDCMVVREEGGRWRATVTVEVHAGSDKHARRAAERVVAAVSDATGGAT